MKDTKNIEGAISEVVRMIDAAGGIEALNARYRQVSEGEEENSEDDEQNLEDWEHNSDDESNSDWKPGMTAEEFFKL